MTRKALQPADDERLGHIEAAQAAGAIGAWEWDVGSDIAWGSPENCRLYGLAEGETLSYARWLELVHPDDREHVDRELRAALSGAGCYDVEFRLASGGAETGEERWLWARGAVHVDDDGKPVRVVGVNIDITSRKRVEREREQAELQSKKANELKKDFLAMLGHELRNPIGAIANGIELLRDDTTDDHRAWARDMIARQTRQLKRLVDDILEVSRVSRGQLVIRPEIVSLSASFEAARDAVRERLQESHRELGVRVPSERIHLHVDPARMQQILANLLSNAIKATDNGGHIRLAAERDGERVLIRVEDDGDGLTEEHLEVIFEPFVRVESSLRRAGSGLGIGLTLVKKLVELHGGTVTAQSDGPGQGCMFTVAFPIHEGEPEADRTGPRRVSRPLAIVVIDDNKDLAMGLQKRLEAAGHEVTLAHDGPDGIRAVRRVRPQVVLVDVGLPSMDGYKVAEELRAAPASNVRIAAISGFKERGEEQRAAETFDHYFLKPVDPEQLNAWLEHVAAELGENDGDG